MTSKELKIYARSIALVWVVLLGLAFGIGLIFSEFNVGIAAATIGCMALNAFAAIAPIYLLSPNFSPINVYLGGMVIRLGLLGLCLVAVMSNLGSPNQGIVLGSALLSFVVFLSAEIKHLVSHPLQAGNS